MYVSLSIVNTTAHIWHHFMDCAYTIVWHENARFEICLPPPVPSVQMYHWNMTRTRRRRLPANQAEQRALQNSGIRDPRGGVALLVVLFSSLSITIRQSLVELSTN